MSRNPLSDRAVADKVGKTHTAIGRWRRGDLRLSPETEAKVLAVLESASAEQRQDRLVKSFGVLALRAFTGGAR